MNHKEITDDVKFNRFWKNLLSKIIIVMIVVFGAAWMYSSHQLKNERIVIIPSHLNAKVEAGGNSASPEYIRVMLTHITALLHNFTEHTARRQFTEFLSYIPPINQERAREGILRRLEEIERLKLSEQFIPDEFHPLPDNRCLFKGKLIKRSAGVEISDAVTSYEYTYRIYLGGFQIDEVKPLTDAEYNAILRRDGK